MSRIHDALRKAEEERTQPSPAAAVVEAVPAQGPPTPVLALSQNRSGTTVSARLAAAVSATDSSPSDGCLTLEVVQQMSVTGWNPDPARVISFEGTRLAIGTEEFRTLRSRLYQLRSAQSLKTVLVTSVLAGEGKTFTAVNLAHTLAQHRSRRVLLIDADLRKPGLHQVLGTRAMPGLSEFLSGEKNELEILQRPSDNLFFVGGGNTVGSAAELIANGRFGRLLVCVSPVFDWIIIDSPPWALVSDANVLADACDGVLLIVQPGTTPVEVAQKVCQQLRSKHLLGVVLNQADETAGYSGYYYRTYGGYAPNETSR